MLNVVIYYLVQRCGLLEASRISSILYALLWVKVDPADYPKAAQSVASRKLISLLASFAVLNVLCFCVGLSQGLNKC